VGDTEGRWSGDGDTTVAMGESVGAMPSLVAWLEGPVVDVDGPHAAMKMAASRPEMRRMGGMGQRYEREAVRPYHPEVLDHPGPHRTRMASPCSVGRAHPWRRSFAASCLTES
jgi:hypothetical protein